MNRENTERAGRAGVALDAYADIPGVDTDAEAVIIDLLTDLRHYCAQTHHDFETAVRLSDVHFQAEG